VLRDLPSDDRFVDLQDLVGRGVPAGAAQLRGSLDVGEQDGEPLSRGVRSGR
jgi:hypothetical protein